MSHKTHHVEEEGVTWEAPSTIALSFYQSIVQCVVQ